VQFTLIQRIFDLIREYASREAGDKLFHPKSVRMVEDVVVDEQVISEKVQLEEDSLSVMTRESEC